MDSSPKNDAKSLGRWTKQEHQKFLVGLQLYGKDWRKIQEFIGTRNGAQIRSHAQKFFLRMKKQLSFDNNSHQQKEASLTIENYQPEQGNSSSEDKMDSPSYYVSKIIKLKSETKEFNFWDALVDDKSCQECEEMETGLNKRKDSFTIWEQEDDQLTEEFPGKKVKVG